MELAMVPQDLIIKLLIISIAAVLAPILSEQLRWFRVPSVVFELILGVLIGPQVLDLVDPLFQINILAKIGLVLLMFLAGYEIDLNKIKGSPLIMASYGWLMSLALALGITVLLTDVGITKHVAIVSLALTTTAFGTLLPILQDAKIFETKLGPFVLAVGTLGEFGPIVVISLLFAVTEPLLTLVFFFLFIVVGVAAAFFAIKMHHSKALLFVRRHLNMSDQLPVRVSMCFILILVSFAIKLELDVLLGAFSAGIVLHLCTQKRDMKAIESKLHAIGFGFLIPLFFIVSGIKLDLYALVSVDCILRMVFFLVCMLIVRGVPAFIFYRKTLTYPEQQALAFFSATGLPLIVVITTLGTASGHMLAVNAVSLVGAGVLSVFLFPILGLNTLRHVKNITIR